ncbi:MAG: UDP-N-acetylmuramoyl-L-alanyl-D-glutamate--2,6-diaminopimelate ligase [Thermomicrobiales bacterium]|nr:UDP-N-acetylmuramoyl-L-alanyl-D-glutamate--2,6-diaminopimelate ligase [Thermomicrobiales bacterium]
MAVRPTVNPRSARLSDLAAAVSDSRVTSDATITGITYDSRDVQPGDLFAALRGSDFDGHAYIRQAIERGASAVLVEEMPEGIDHPAIIVGDTRRDLAPLAAKFYGHPSRELLTIGLTGTDGKTTTTALVKWILAEAGIRTGTIGTLGIEIGNGETISLGHQTTPESHLVQGYLRQMVEAGTQAVVIEATSHGLAMHRLDSTRFTIAGVTNITHEHLEYHKTIEAYRAAKGILIERVAQVNGTIVLNADDEGAMSLEPLSAGAALRTYAMSGSKAGLSARDVRANHNGSAFTLVADSFSWQVQLPLLGEFNIANALCAVAVCEAAGVPIETAIEALSRAPGVSGRMQMVNEGQDFGVVVDYAHTPASLEKILTLLRGLAPQNRLIVVSGSAGERDIEKRPLQGRVMAELADVVVITSEDPRNEDPMAIIEEIAAGADRNAAELHTIEDRREAIALAFEAATPGDIVLLAGKGHETSIIWGFEHRPWDEEAVARELLRTMTSYH